MSQTLASPTQGPRKTLLSDALDPSLDVQRCDLDYWFREVATTFGQQERGHTLGARPPHWMFEEGPLRQSMLEEFGFRARTEEAATRFITHIVRAAPTLATMDFYASQLLDEARHAHVFRHHLIDLGVAAADIEAELDRLSGDKVTTILAPLEAFMGPAIAAGDFIAMVVFLAIIAEGALAPAAEISSLRWASVDPAAAQIGYGANLDEIRHLAVGTSIVKGYVSARPDERARLAALIRGGLRLFAELPIAEMIVRREVLFQQGLMQHARHFRDVELLPGRRLLDTTVEERLALQQTWSDQMRATRLQQMGLADGHA